MRFSEAKKQQIIELYRSGMKVSQIAKLGLCTRATARCLTDPEFRRKYNEKNRGVRYAQDDHMEQIEINPLYDPLRDGPPRHSNVTGALMGDPPIGRQALLQQWAQEHPQRPEPTLPPGYKTEPKA